MRPEHMLRHRSLVYYYAAYSGIAMNWNACNVYFVRDEYVVPHNICDIHYYSYCYHC